MTTKLKTKKLNRIKAVLAETGHPGKWLAEQLRKDPATVSKWCTNTLQPDLYTIRQISEILKIDNRMLLTPSNTCALYFYFMMNRNNLRELKCKI